MENFDPTEIPLNNYLCEKDCETLFTKRARVSSGLENECLTTEKCFESSSASQNFQETLNTKAIGNTPKEEFLNLRSLEDGVTGDQHAMQKDIKCPANNESEDFTEWDLIQRKEEPVTVLCVESGSKCLLRENLGQQGQMQGLQSDGNTCLVFHLGDDTGDPSLTGDMQRCLLYSADMAEMPDVLEGPKDNCADLKTRMQWSTSSGSNAETVDCAFGNTTADAARPSLDKTPSLSQEASNDIEHDANQDKSSEKKPEVCILLTDYISSLSQCTEKNASRDVAKMEKNERQYEGSRTPLKVDEKHGMEICGMEAKANSLHTECAIPEKELYINDPVDAQSKNNLGSCLAKNNIELHHILSVSAKENPFCESAENSRCGECMAGRGQEKDDLKTVADARKVPIVTETDVDSESSRMGQPKHIATRSDTQRPERQSAKILEKINRNQQDRCEERHQMKHDEVTDDCTGSLDGFPVTKRDVLTDNSLLVMLQGDETTVEDGKKSPNSTLITNIQHGTTQTGEEGLNGTVHTDSHVPEQHCTARDETEIENSEEHSCKKFSPRGTSFSVNDLKVSDGNSVEVDITCPYSGTVSSKPIHHENNSDNRVSFLNNQTLKQIECYSTNTALHTGLENPNQGQIYSITSNKPSKELLNLCNIETVTVAQSNGWTEKDICEQQRKVLNEEVKESVSANSRADVMQAIVPEGNYLSDAFLPSDAVVPQCNCDPVDEQVGNKKENGAQSPLPFIPDPASVALDTFEKIQLIPEAELQCSSLLSPSPRIMSQSNSDIMASLNESKLIQLANEQTLGYCCASMLFTENKCFEVLSGQRFALCNSRIEMNSSHSARDEKCINSVVYGMKQENQIPLFSVLTETECSQEASNSVVTVGRSAPQNVLPEVKQFPLELTEEKGICTSNAEDKNMPAPEMKQKFDLVLEELRLFQEINSETETLPGCTQFATMANTNPDGENSDFGFGNMRTSKTSHDRIDKGLHRCMMGTARECPEDKNDRRSSESEQEVPLECGHLTTEVEDSMYSVVKQKDGCRETLKGCKNWTPAFSFSPSFDGQNERLAEHPRRLEPLKTCSRPIRVGLSRRARPKQLHQYLKRGYQT